MSQTKIRAHSQVLPNSIYDSEINIAAGIQTAKLADAARFMMNDGSVAFVAPVTGVDPTQPQHLATKNYVDGVKQALDIKESVLAATTGNISLAGGAPNSLDGVVLAVGSRILVKDQTTASQNGIYVVQTLGAGADGTWVRALDADVSADVTSGLFAYVEQGTANGANAYVLTTTGTIVLNTTNLTFTQFSGAGQIIAGNGMSKTGNRLDVVGTAGRISSTASGIDLVTTGVAAGTYFKTTVDAYGRVTNGSNPTTLAGFAITDAQPLSAILSSITALSATGIIARTGNGTTASRTLAAPSRGFTITNADGVLGNPTFVLANNLAAIEGLQALGFATRTGADTWVQRSITGTAGRIIVSDGDGVANAPAIDLATSGVGAGSYHGVTVDVYGRVTAGTNPTTIAGYAITDAVNKTGDTMTGYLTLFANPTQGLHAATKNYVDAVQQALDLKASVRVGTTANVVLAGGAPTVVDGVTLAANDRVLVKAQTNGAENGIYYVQTIGSGANGTWLRANDADISAEVTSGMYTYISEGTLAASSGWVLTTPDPIVLGTTPLSFTQFSGAGQIIAGNGITKSGNRLDVVSGNAAIVSTIGNLSLALADTTLTIVGTGLKLASLPNGQMLVGNALNTAAPVTMSGDATMSNAGVVTLNPNALKATNYIVRETPTGSIDGINNTFALAFTPVVGTEMVFANGILLEQGTGNDYTIAGNTITMLFTLQAGDRLKATYFK